MNALYYLEVIEWLLSYGPSCLIFECNIGARQPPKSNIGHGGPCAKAIL